MYPRNEKGEREGLQYKTPAPHLRIWDVMGSHERWGHIMAARGLSKSTTVKFNILNIALYGRILLGMEGTPKELRYLMYISDSIKNGVKTMREDLENSCLNNHFLKQYLSIDFIADEWWFYSHISRKELCISAYGIDTGIRGNRRLDTRAQAVFLDDLLSDKKGSSDVELEKATDILSGGIKFSAEPDAIFRYLGTPFRPNDPLYMRMNAGIGECLWLPVCEKFPCTREEFSGAWEDRYNYDFIKNEYDENLETGTLHVFSREMMLRLGTKDDLLINPDEDIVWTSLHGVDLRNCNVYITTDFATSSRRGSDYSVILVWAVGPDKMRYLIDGYAAVETLDKTLDKLFSFAKQYDPISVGIEVSGQQGGFIRWIYQRMQETGILFNIAKNVKGVAGYSDNRDIVGLYPVANKLQRFKNTIPLFKIRRIAFMLEHIEQPWMIELIDEITKATSGGLNAIHDDVIDAISQIMAMDILEPTQDMGSISKGNVRIDESTYNNPYGKTLSSQEDLLEDYSYYTIMEY